MKLKATQGDAWFLVGMQGLAGLAIGTVAANGIFGWGWWCYLAAAAFAAIMVGTAITNKWVRRG